MAQESRVVEKKQAVPQGVGVQKKQAPPESNVKETIESILVAFILAFVFRAFVVEAFVIPTGSLGPTLMGAHMRFTCPDCGYQYTVNFPAPDENNIPSDEARVADFHCPNCGYTIPASNRNRGTADWSPVYYGDRILVLKYRYLFGPPHPWDVVVFKSPYEQERDPDDPKYNVNYIKRDIGNPGEAVMILDGDIYVANAAETDLSKFKIRRKPWYAQQALWRIVNDNDYLPHLPNGPGRDWQQPWTIDSGTGWTGPRDANHDGRARIFRFDNANSSGSFIFDASANSEIHTLTDWLAYNQTQQPGQHYPIPVSDLRISCVYQRQSGDGPLTLQLSKRDDLFEAQFVRGAVQLTLMNEKQKKVLWQMSKQVPQLSASSPVELEFTNVDYRVAVKVNGVEVLATDDSQYYPNIAQLLDEYRAGKIAPAARVRIEAAKQACTISHLSLWRDVYYLNSGQHRYGPGGWRDPAGAFWGSPDNVVRLENDEYFVLGDNSEVSLDARYWGAPVDLPQEGNYQVKPGRVPGRFMLGKAFFVYWPAGYRPPSIPFGIEPDFGDMRFIH